MGRHDSFQTIVNHAPERKNIFHLDILQAPAVHGKCEMGVFLNPSMSWEMLTYGCHPGIMHPYHP